MFTLLVTAFLLFPSILGAVYFLERAWLLIRADEASLNAVLDRDFWLGRQLWIAFAGAAGSTGIVVATSGAPRRRLA